MPCWKENGRQEWIQIYCGIALICYFSIVGILSFAIPCGRYNAAKEPGFEYDGPGAYMISLHWVCYIGGILGGIGLMFTVNCFAAFMTFVVIGACALWIGWLVYMVLFFVLKWTVTYQVMSIADFRKMNEAALSKTPAYEVYASGYYSAGRKRGYNCETPRRYFNTTVHWASDEMVWLDENNIGDKAYRIRTTIQLLMSDEELAFVEEAKRIIAKCTDNLNRVGKVKAHAAGFIDGYNREVVVTKDGSWPSVWNKAAGGAAGFFAFGVVYLYDLARNIPIIPYTMTKNVSFVDGTEQVTCDGIACYHENKFK